MYRLINKALREGSLVCYERGVYFIPSKTFFGISSIDSDQVAEKRYTRNDDSVYGLYSGLSLLNSFGITTQMPNSIEIITNKEATRKREVRISGRPYLVRKSRCEITKDNYASYTILQLFLDMNDNDSLNCSSIEKIRYFMDKNDVTLKNLVEISTYFPGKAVKRMMRSPIFYDAIRE